MTLGFLSAILADSSFEEVIDVASQLGYGCVELACWPKRDATRRYAGVSHLDMDSFDDEKADYVKNYLKEKGVFISSLGYYPNTLDPDLSAREAAVSHIKKLIVASDKLGIGMVTTFIGRDQTKTVEENLKTVAEVWRPIMKLAEQHNVKVGIENCPMLFDNTQWPGGQNLFTSPANWAKIIDVIGSKNLGINFDPSHFIWQFLDYTAAVHDFKDRIFHTHAKDIKLYTDKLAKVGTMGYPLDFMAPKLPGLGDVNWGQFISALNDEEYTGAVCVEVEDRAFEGSYDNIIKSLELSKRYLDQFII